MEQKQHSKKPHGEEYSSDLIKVFKLCLEVFDRAYCPYSNFHVASVVKVSVGGKDRFFSGCNVENASYGATICAERVALTNVVANMGKQNIDYLMLMTKEGREGDVPCGSCLQVMQEFCPSDMPVYIASRKGICRVFKMKELLPFGFCL